MQGRSTLGQLTILVRDELLLVIKTVADVGVVMALVGHHLVEEVLVVDLGCRRVNFLLECRVLLEHTFARFDISHNLLGLEDAYGAIGYVELETRSCLSHRRVAGALPLRRMIGRLRCHTECKSTLHW